ncbi:MAG TPA: response regulator, partial [Phycisphaerae bacterium]|nr:response regulator [Phycisphaerae bacterium]
VRLPVIVASSTKPSVDRDDGDLGSADLHGTRILIVDDDEATRDVVARTLREYAATTECAPGADEALRLFSQSRPDILICDIGMPVKDGYALIREIREKDPDVPAVALTAYTRAEDRARALAAGYNIHIPKPINPQELVRVVSELAQRSRSKSFAQPGNCSDTEPSVRAARPPLTPLS